MRGIQYIGIIPARWGSTRFPGKPLAMIGGKTMIHRVWEQARKVLEDVVVATDDPRIYEEVVGFGGTAVMTRTDHRCGTDRCVEALDKWSQEHETSAMEDIVVVNIQGDEPFIQPEQIQALMRCFEQEDTEIATLVKPFRPEDGWAALENPNSPKVVFTRDHRALLFSRSVIPYCRGVEKEQWLESGKYYKHVGMYAYRARVLQAISQLPPSSLEQAESLEQMRWVENGYCIRVAECEVESYGIDTPEDLEKMKNKINDKIIQL